MDAFFLLKLLAILWGAITAVLVGLVIYRAVVGIHEEDQVFLDRAEAALEQAQIETLIRIQRVDLYVKGFAIASGVLLLVTAAIWVYLGLYTPITR